MEEPEEQVNVNKIVMTEFVAARMEVIISVMILILMSILWMRYAAARLVLVVLVIPLPHYLLNVMRKNVIVILGMMRVVEEEHVLNMRCIRQEIVTPIIVSLKRDVTQTILHVK